MATKHDWFNVFIVNCEEMNPLPAAFFMTLKASYNQACLTRVQLQWETTPQSETGCENESIHLSFISVTGHSSAGADPSCLQANVRVQHRVSVLEADNRSLTSTPADD